MREIKFRAWEKNLKEIIPVNNINLEKKMVNTDSAWRLFNEIELMQYTGLKDKNGKEIYEGDIIDWQSNVGFYVGFKKGSFVAIPLDKIQRLNWEHYPLSKMNNKIWAVEGNIYENPELLKE